jgi:hypothetical protein
MLIRHALFERLARFVFFDDRAGETSGYFVDVALNFGELD